MKKSTKLICATLAFQTAFSSMALAATDAFEYPELLVTPRASERVESEAKREGERRWTTHLPIQASALATFTTGMIQVVSDGSVKNTTKNSGLVGVGVGGAWLVVTGLLAASYSPYHSASEQVGAMPRKTQREQLLRERAAEESIKSASRLGARLKWLSVVSNLGASAYMLSNAPSTSVGFVAGGIAAAASFAPVLFRYRWQDVAHEQSEYKKRIYGPIASLDVSGTMLSDSLGNTAPGMLVALRF